MDSFTRSVKMLFSTLSFHFNLKTGHKLLKPILTFIRDKTSYLVYTFHSIMLYRSDMKFSPKSLMEKTPWITR